MVENKEQSKDESTWLITDGKVSEREVVALSEALKENTTVTKLNLNSDLIKTNARIGE